MLAFIKKIKRKIFGSSNHRDFLLKLMPRDAICAEIGSWKGDFSNRILKKTYPKKLYLIDPYKFVEEYKNALFGGLVGGQQKMDEIYDSVINRFQKEIRNGKLEIVRKYSYDAHKNIKDKFFDWIYIDGNHTYEFIKQDLNNFYPKVKINGFITGDDYVNTGWWEDGVIRAVDEFVTNNKSNIEVILIRKGQFILKKIK